MQQASVQIDPLLVSNLTIGRPTDRKKSSLQGEELCETIMHLSYNPKPLPVSGIASPSAIKAMVAQSHGDVECKVNGPCGKISNKGNNMWAGNSTVQKDTRQASVTTLLCMVTGYPL
jgi:hypothetical protein